MLVGWLVGRRYEEGKINVEGSVWREKGGCGCVGVKGRSGRRRGERRKGEEYSGGREGGRVNKE